MTTSISNGATTATIHHKGAELISLESYGREYIWEGRPDFWGKHSPVLFPIVGTLKNNTYTFNGNEYCMSRHGFARDMVFSLEQKTETVAVFLLQHDENTLKIYPFEFAFRIIYTISENQLEIAYRVSNLGNGTQYFSLGAHPAFALPEAFGKYTLEINVVEPLLTNLLENDLLSDTTVSIGLTDGKLALDYTLFEKDALIFRDAAFHSVTILENQKPLLKVDFEDFPDLGLWTKINAPFLCIEPWFGYSDVVDTNQKFEEKHGIILLKPTENFNAKFKITLCNA
ncbi:aldose 1-epimerase family protein [Flavobacterium pallidum]|uniref:Aldose epimerase n=1 Tax=Flavobacterium pallidum TaxID=2172098 RepID=A0A2S1SHY9_9FLAO|nr:aldose 1-epimerase family protein [Flavobacterium pallidum]AWI25979.1 aldose epimerase [Flavobacterium pallidum]